MVSLWTSLLDELQVTGATEVPQSGGVARVEAVLGLKLPAGYPEFCEVFGFGQLGGFIVIYCPCTAPNQADAQSSFAVDALRQELKLEREREASGHPGASLAKLELSEKILANAYVFGTNPNGHSFLWDLNSYQETGASADIYLVPHDDLERTTLVGRDFFSFVRDFCLGNQANEVLPPEINFYSELTGKTFHRIDTAILKERM